MIRVRQMKIKIEDDSKEELLKSIAYKIHKNESFIKDYKIHKMSIDARHKPDIYYIYEVDIAIDNEEDFLNKYTSIDIFKSPDERYIFNDYGVNKIQNHPIIVGAGPAGLFCAYLFSLNGFKPIVIERGEDVDRRISTINEFFLNNKLNPESNVQFGEGGAGTFSDGKLNTLTSDKENRQRFVFETFIKFGAPKEIIYDSKPHIGTDILQNVIKNMRNEIIKLGGTFRFNTKLTNILIKDNKVVGVETNYKDHIKTDDLVLAIGHSARDTFKLLNDLGLDMESKPFAVGIRIIHNQSMINRSQYGSKCNLLPPASYKLTYKASNGHGVYSFCMCPGGFVVNSSSEEGKLAINGMSNYKRDSSNANSAIIVTVSNKDFGNDLFDGIRFQQNLEEKAYEIGHGLIPIQLYKDYVLNKTSTNLASVMPELKGSFYLSNLNDLFPDFINLSLKEGINAFDKKINGFASNDTVIAGVESRTSSPIRIIRDENGCSNILGIYPCGEGAGYAGGITSAAVDGVKVFENIAKKYCK